MRILKSLGLAIGIVLGCYLLTVGVTMLAILAASHPIIGTVALFLALVLGVTVVLRVTIYGKS